MDEKNPLDREERLPGEVVETYRPRDTREVVEIYVRPLPGVSRDEEEAAGVWRKGPVPLRKSRTGLWIFLLALLTAVALALGSWVLSFRQEEKNPAAEADRAASTEITMPTYPWGEGASLSLTKDPGEKLTPQAVYERVNPAVVMVLAQLEEGVSMGTGVIFSQEGYILTNYHVVEGGEDCMVVLENDMGLPASYVAGDEEFDLAVLKADISDLPMMEGLTTAEFGNSEKLQVGDTVYAIGNPLNVNLRGTFTNGIVSAIDRDVPVDGRIMNLIQTNAALNSGNSGGPLINESGQVIGINVIKMISNRHEYVEGLGFAIPSATVDRLVNDLLTYGEAQPEPLMGMTVLQKGETLGEGLRGVEVVDVLPHSAADRAGMKIGDFVVQVGDTAVGHSRDVFWARRQLHVGDCVGVTVWRDGDLLDLEFDLQEAVE